MKFSRLSWIVYILAIFISGCVSKTHFLNVSKEYQAQIKLTEQALQNCKLKHEKIISLQQSVIGLFDDSHHTLQKSIKERLADENLKIPQISSPTRLVLLNQLMFPSGSTDLNDAEKALLKNMRDVLNKQPYKMLIIKGHTDSQRLRSTSPYHNNWELSIARSVVVARFLIKEGIVPPEKISILGFGKYQPADTNDTSEGRNVNRRIEIFLERS